MKFYMGCEIVSCGSSSQNISHVSKYVTLALLLIALFLIANNIIYYSPSYRYAVVAYGVTLFVFGIVLTIFSISDYMTGNRYTFATKIIDGIFLVLTSFVLGASSEGTILISGIGSLIIIILGWTVLRVFIDAIFIRRESRQERV